MQQSQDSLQDLTKCTLAIENPDTGKVLGTGVIVTDDGLIVTCYHVLENIISNTKTVSINFPTVVKTKMQADIVQESYNQSLDIAFLKLQTKQPDRMIAANLSEMVSPTHPFIGFGFKKAQEFDGLHVKGEIQGKAHKISRDGTISPPPLIQLQSHQIAPGMSGSAILDTESNKVIGIVSEMYRTQDDAYKDLSFGIPVDSIIKVCPSLKEKNPGLLKIRQFMEKIGLVDSYIYRRFDDIYVPPIGYENIINTLQENHCVFITGTKEYGKTYTAFKLLWEYYKKGYVPKYISETKEEVAKIVKQLGDRDDRLRNHAIYIEDPVGKTEYFPNEDFRRHIVSALKNAKRQDVYLIVTMREEIYNEFNPIGKVDPEIYVEKLSIAEHSYDYEKRREILARWAEVMNCRWLQNDKLRDTVFKALLDESILPTPLNIKDFAMETDETFYTNSEQELLDIMRTRSRDTVESFADEIKVMKAYRILFLSFPFISEGFSVGFVEAEYQKLAQELKNEGIINEYVIDFKSVLDSFRNNKINILYDKINFSHPSYLEAFQDAISEKGVTTKIGEILSTVLIKIADNKYAAFYVAEAVNKNFDRLPENVRNELLLKLADNEDTAESVSNILQVNFDRLPGDYIYKLLIRLVSNNYMFWDTVGTVVSTIGSNFDKLPENTRNLLFTLADNDNNDAALILVSTLRDNFDKLPEDVKYRLLEKIVETNSKAWDGGKNTSSAEVIVGLLLSNYYKLPNDVRNLVFTLADKTAISKHMSGMLKYYFDDLPKDVRNILLTKLAEDEKIAYSLAETIFYNYDKMQVMGNELLLKILPKLAENKEIAEDVAHAIVNNFDKLPDNVRNELLLKLAENKEAAYYVVEAIDDNFDKLPDNVRNELLLKLAENKEAAWYVASAVSSNFDKLPENVQNLLFKLAENKEAALDVARAVSLNFDKLPENVRNELLLKVAENKEAAYAVADAVANNFDKLPEKVQNLLFKLAEDKEGAVGVAYGIARNFDKLPENVQNLLFKLAENKDVARDVAYGIAGNFDKLPENVQNLLFKLAEDKEGAVGVAYGIARNFDKLPENVRNELLLKVAENKEAAYAVADAVANNFDKLPEKVQNLLFKLAENEETARSVAKAVYYYFDKLPDNIRNELLRKVKRE